MAISGLVCWYRFTAECGQSVMLFVNFEHTQDFSGNESASQNEITISLCFSRHNS